MPDGIFSLLLNITKINLCTFRRKKMGKLSKLISVTALAAATGAGVYYYLNKSQLESAKKADGAEGVTGTGTTAQDSVADFFREKKEAIMNSREYVTISENVSVAKDALVKTVTEAAEMVKEKAAEVRDGVGVVADDAKDKAEDFSFEEFKDDMEEIADVAADLAGDKVEEIKVETADVAFVKEEAEAVAETVADAVEEVVEEAADAVEDVAE